MLFLSVFMLGGCSSEGEELKKNIPYSTARIGNSQTAKDSGSDTKIIIYNSQEQCADFIYDLNEDRPKNQKMTRAFREGETLNCTPWFDRKNGEVQLSFSVESNDEILSLPLEDKHLAIRHNNNVVSNEGNVTAGNVAKIIPHEPTLGSQLYILIIDGSASMTEKDGTRTSRMEKVRRALMRKDVQEAFFPKGSKNNLLVFTFTNGDPTPLGGKREFISNKKDYYNLIKDHLKAQKGYTHLYKAIGYGIDIIETDRKIKKFLTRQEASPTILVLTDGFNNISNEDTCQSNVTPLRELIEKIDNNQNDQKDLFLRTRIFTIGLGRPIKSKPNIPKDNLLNVDATRLCGSAKNKKIDGDLETLGIDNVSLEWIAKTAKGESFVKRSSKELASAFKKAAAIRYKWFEVRYKVSPTWVRQTFTTDFQIKNFANARSTINIYPHAWLDGPPGKERSDKWTDPKSSRHSAVIFMNIIGGLLFISILGAAIFNIRRVLGGRLSPPK